MAKLKIIPIPKNLPKYVIGIDCGTNTGLAVWNRSEKQFETLKTFKIHDALFFIKDFIAKQVEFCVFIENPNTFVGFKGKFAENKSKLQGAGSIKRDYAIWEDFLNDNKITFFPTRLQGNIKKITKEQFFAFTGVKIQTSEHARDAAMIVFGL